MPFVISKGELAAGGEMVKEVRRALVGVRTTLEASAARQAEEANNTLKFLKSRELKALAEKVPVLKKRLPKIADEAKTQLEEAKALRTFQEQALAQLDKDLNDLAKRFS